jgi:quinol monooxygenase YgiN
MFARVVEYVPKLEKKDEMFKLIRQEIIPLARKQPGFLDYLALIPETTGEKFITIALWTGKAEADRFLKEHFSKVEAMMQPFLTAPTAYTLRSYEVETTVCQHLVDALTAAA